MKRIPFPMIFSILCMACSLAFVDESTSLEFYLLGCAIFLWLMFMWGDR